jgi:hypothetical protein
MNIIANAGFAEIQFQRKINSTLPENYKVIMNSLYVLHAYSFNELIFDQP